MWQVRPMRPIVALALAAACGSSSSPPPTQGEQVRSVIHDVNGHVIVIKAENFADYRDVLATTAGFDSQIVAAGSMLFAEANLLTKDNGSPILLKGISPNHTALRSDFAKYIIDGSLDTKLPDAMPIAIGHALAMKLKVKIGDRLEVDLVDRINQRPRGAAQVTAIFQTPYPDYNHVLVLTTLEGVQALLGKGDVALGIELKLQDFTQATRIAGSLGTKLGDKFKVIDWCDLNRALLQCKDSTSPAPAEIK
jgi:ABC-type lipoprotein release transport system permease subunit